MDMSSTEIILPMPDIQAIAISKRFPRDRQTSCDYMCTIHKYFYPPNSTLDWPRKVGDIGRSHMEELLSQVDSAAVGSKPYLGGLISPVLVDGKIYTDDCVFWLSKVKSGERYDYVYRKCPE
jgi:hypothetical protein